MLDDCSVDRLSLVLPLRGLGGSGGSEVSRRIASDTGVRGEFASGSCDSGALANGETEIEPSGDGAAFTPRMEIVACVRLKSQVSTRV